MAILEETKHLPGSSPKENVLVLKGQMSDTASRQNTCKIKYYILEGKMKPSEDSEFKKRREHSSLNSNFQAVGFCPVLPSKERTALCLPVMPFSSDPSLVPLLQSATSAAGVEYPLGGWVCLSQPVGSPPCPALLVCPLIGQQTPASPDRLAVPSLSGSRSHPLPLFWLFQ